MSEIKITEQDVGRSYIGRDGREYEILSFSEKSVYQFTVGIKEQALETIAANGKASLIDELCGADFKEWADEDEKMGSKIELKVGQKVKLRNGDEGVVKSKLDKVTNFEFAIEHLSDSEECNYTLDGCFYKDKMTSEYDVIEILEEADMKEESTGKYELRLTVVDAKGSATTDKSYHDSLADVDGYVFSNTRGIVDLDQPNSDYSVLRFLLRAKSDVVKISRQINILNVNIATVTIRVTKLED